MKIVKFCQLISLAIIPVTIFASTALAEQNLCAGKKPNSITLFKQEVTRNKPLPEAVSEFNVGDNMWALLCLPQAVGPQKSGGTNFRVVLYIKQVNIPEGQYSQFKEFKQQTVFRPGLTKPRKELILLINEDFKTDSIVKYEMDPGEYEFRLQAATEKGTGKLDVTVDLNNDVAYLQELRKAGYIADVKFKVIKK